MIHSFENAKRSWLPRSSRLAAFGHAALCCGSLLTSACSDDDGANVVPNAGAGGRGGSAGAGGSAGSAGDAGSSGAGGDAGSSREATGTRTLLSAGAALRGPTTAALRGQDLWVVNGQLGGLFGGPAPEPPFTVVSVPLAGGAIGSSVITLPNPENFYPEGIAAAADGTLYVGSLSLGLVVRVPANSTTPDAEPFVAAGVAERGVVGLAVDEPRNILWFCDSGPTAPVQGAALVGVSLTSAGGATPGAEVVRHAMPNPGASAALDAGSSDAGSSDAGGSDASSADASADAGIVAPAGVASFCNDIIIDPDTQDVLATDSNGGRIFRVRSANVLTANRAEIWLSAPSLAAPAGGGYGANGLDFAGGSLITCISNGDLIAIDPTSSDPASTLRTVTLTGGGLCGPDGLQAVPGSPNDIVVIENGSCANPPGGDGDRVSRVTLDL
jgi:hypothetical protein